MSHVNVEIKARCRDHEKIRSLLKSRAARDVGTDYQTDTYFHVPEGRLKVREGNIENALIHYDRENEKGPKRSDVSLFKLDKDSELPVILQRALEVDVVVEKAREIYFVDNVKIHLDRVAHLGMFVEIEAIGLDGTIGIQSLHEQCREYLDLFELSDDDLISESYSDMLRRRGLAAA